MSVAALHHQCPQCGAPVQLEETDRIFTCPYCQVRLFIHADGPFQYYIPPRTHASGTLLYLPYWRLRGNAFVLGREVMQHKILDSSLLAASQPQAPATLGLRSQALSMRFVEPDTDGQFLAPTLPYQDFTRHLLQALPGMRAVSGPRLTACVGHAVSLIYQPFYATEKLIDGLTGQNLGPLQHIPEAKHPPEPGLRFISTLCPQCGWDLSGDRSSMVQACRHCDTLWRPGPNGLDRVPVSFFTDVENPALYLPFWSLSVRASGFALRTWADLIRLTNLPRPILPWMETTPFTFRIPAFKIRPSLFLNLSARISLFQPDATVVETLPQAPLHPVTLDEEQAVKALPPILGRLAPARKLLFERIQGGRLHAESVCLHYIPFTDNNSELLQPAMNMAVQKNALFWSATL